MSLKTDENTNADIRFAGLSNAEIMKVYYSMKRQQEIMDGNLANNKLLRLIENKGLFDYRMIDVSDEMISEFKKSEYYNLIGSVVNTLQPIVLLLEECDDKLRILSDELR